MNPDQYDMSKEQLELIARRAAMRQKLKAEYNKLEFNPFRIAFRNHVEDPQILLNDQLFMYRIMHKKPRWDSFMWFMRWCVIPIVGSGYYLQKDWEAKNAKIRRGEIPYDDRKNQY